MPKYDFMCRRGHRFELEVERGQRSISCSFCGAPAEREFSVPLLPAINGRAREPQSQRVTHIGEYQEASEQLHHEFERYKDSTQQESLQEPDLWTPVKRAAADVLAGKRKPPAGWTPVSFT